jgi:hypothetical protein
MYAYPNIGFERDKLAASKSNKENIEKREDGKGMRGGEGRGRGRQFSAFEIKNYFLKLILLKF